MGEPINLLLQVGVTSPRSNVFDLFEVFLLMGVGHSQEEKKGHLLRHLTEGFFLPCNLLKGALPLWCDKLTPLINNLDFGASSQVITLQSQLINQKAVCFCLILELKGLCYIACHSRPLGAEVNSEIRGR